jgi:hypothetical protein
MLVSLILKIRKYHVKVPMSMRKYHVIQFLTDKTYERVFFSFQLNLQQGNTNANNQIMFPRTNQFSKSFP